MLRNTVLSKSNKSINTIPDYNKCLIWKLVVVKICEFYHSIMFEISTFVGIIPQFHDLPTLLSLDMHAARFTSNAFDKLKKRSPLHAFFFLLQPLEYVNPLVSQWTKTWKYITDKYFFRKWLNIIYRFVLNNSIPFIQENKKWKHLDDFNNRCTSHVFQYHATMSAFVYVHWLCARCRWKIFLNMDWTYSLFCYT